MKIVATFKKLFSLMGKVYKIYNELPDEKKEKINDVAVKAISKAIEKM